VKHQPPVPWWPWVCLGLALMFLYFVYYGLTTGSIFKGYWGKPFYAQDWSYYYDRQTQPRRFWLMVFYDLTMALTLIVISVLKLLGTDLVV
jgi:hypothetical protein